ncbi:glycogen/starch synthase [Candidatus Woesearchaeota archaeon]|nr:glycogen/starch synthase [Candidatus Woesearchaeota archaeon]
MDTKAEAVFELSWEVCNKVGGIYTVIMSKAAKMLENYQHYFLIGPYFPNKKVPEFVEEEAPDDLKDVFNKLLEQGIGCHYGKWLVKGSPKVILIDYAFLSSSQDKILTDLWQNFQVDSFGVDSEYVNPVIWSTAAGKFIELYSQKFPDKKIAAHFHEWLAGAGLLYLKQKNVKVGTVFTTHATMLGRSIAGSGKDLYSMLGNFDPDTEAKNHGVHSKYSMERASAQNCDCFTTVSEITGIEAEHILGRKPDVLVPNGLDSEKFPSYEEIAIAHRQSRAKIKEMVATYFLPYQNFDLDNTYFYYIFGRYEFRNKGIDIFIRALGQLNNKLKQDKSEKTIVAYFWIPTWTHGLKKVMLENKAYFNEINNSVFNHIDSIKHKLIGSIITGQDMTKINLFDEDFILESRKLASNFKKEGHPGFVTHSLDNEENDLIIKACREAGLNNVQEDKVKVIFHPAYLTGTDGLLDLSYYEAMVGGHLGVYPSYYEPWGYTPLESASWGVPAITTDLAGFGMWINKNKKQDDKGIVVLSYFNKSQEEVTNVLAEQMYEYSKLDRKGRVERKINAKKLSKLADWGQLISHYVEAHNFAVDKITK